MAEVLEAIRAGNVGTLEIVQLGEATKTFTNPEFLEVLGAVFDGPPAAGKFLPILRTSFASRVFSRADEVRAAVMLGVRKTVKVTDDEMVYAAGSDHEFGTMVLHGDFPEDALAVGPRPLTVRVCMKNQHLEDARTLLNAAQIDPFNTAK